MRLSQRQIEIFNAVMIYKSATAAAEALGTSQPTVSRELRELESYLGFELFNRFGKRLSPTKQALLLHSAVSRSFVGMQEISRVALAIKQHNAAQLRIASLPAYAEAFLPMVVQRFLNNKSQVHLSIHSLEEVQLRHDITTQMFDIGLTEGSLETDDATTETIDVGEVVCVLPCNHPLTSKSVLEPKDFQGADFVYFTQEDPYRRKIDLIFEAEGISRRYCVEATTATGVCSMVASGVGVSIVNPLTASHYAAKGVALRRFSVLVPYQLNLWRPAKTLRSTHADLFVNVMRQVANEVVEKLRSL
ncbi:LysR family transcriptional regulator [Mesorhizobium sp. M8A.F.Ca.ET.208.01.1.1]|uniref:LysR family transcriptional regulator n=1 Tax=unclassified Mesorhizobium TaxID=325217 RepID=UPI000F74D01E|nr:MULTISPECIES: LysR family transcriptional regulator [unclassified Mesorhizobium]RUW99646.1 LysR family transcriptional regulator [Mesorhizobium sp. M8A.F.Ca.ET.059.01.1.1]AZO54358.1 LysR family transcriptional regulator [Mesorhizobium sp. M8A.F.Ca.ET.057.01.1.1]RWE49798.1 MAG: LysR family transcriptional regulator [Mesorhizobium sp.]TGQ94528.1 LysR family transcriptional regulator [Mesorhizobium sp. M8A.F.Ca.ET.208.01.1.1]TGT55016.1 LysR family transcriptional regulator [Mesorhizobium sp. M